MSDLRNFCGAQGLPLSASDGTTAYASAAHYAPQGALASLQNGTNLYTTEIYNGRLQPCWIYANVGSALNWASATQCTTADTVPSGSVVDLKYNFDLGAGNNDNVFGITNDRDSTRSQVFTYDPLNRIQTAGTVNTSGTNCWGEAYGIDAWGNLSSLALPSGYSSACAHETPYSYTMSTKNQLPSASDFTYDSSGNLMVTGFGSYTYNAENQMTAATNGSTTSYTYDGDGKRVEKSGGKIYWYGGGPDALDETDLSGNTNNATFSEYVFFGGNRIARRDYQSNVFYYFADHLGTSREMVQSGQTSFCYDADFYPYGGEIPYTTSCTQNYKFTGKERDSESSSDDFGARYYSSMLGRFVSSDWSDSPDSVPYADRQNPQSLNLYTYVHNNPLSHADPDGHCDVDGEHHGALWCFAHALGLAQTEKEKIASEDAYIRSEFQHTKVVDEGGNAVDINKLSHQQLVDLDQQYWDSRCPMPMCDSTILGWGGTRVTSKTLWQGEGGRIDVENPNPGQRPGQIHYQDASGKYIYDLTTRSFRGAPNAVNELLNRDDVQRAIQTGLRYLGVGK